MHNTWHRIKSYLRHVFCAKTSRGDGVHSPFVFSFITDVKNEKNPYYAYTPIEQIRQNLLNDKTLLHTTDYGTGGSRTRSVSDIAKKSLKSRKQAQLLFRMVRAYQPAVIFDLGTCLGTTTLYLAQGNKQATVHSFEGCPQTASIAQTNFSNAKCSNIQLHIGNLDDTLPQVLQQIDGLDFVFFDANHQKQPTLQYFNQCIAKANKNGIFVFDDIHWSEGMEQAWKIVKQHPKVTTSIDLYHMGILFFNPELKPATYRIKL